MSKKSDEYEIRLKLYPAARVSVDLLASMFPPEPKLFGRLTRDMGTLGQFRRQRRAPHTRVFYIPCGNSRGWRSLQNATPEEILSHIKYCASRLEHPAVSLEQVEFVLDMCYEELDKRLKDE